MIPKTIHQIWVGRFPVPQGVALWGPANPEWDHRLWREADVEPLVADYGLRDMYDAYTGDQNEGAGKANIARYCILHAHGGVYLDADTEPLRPLDDRFVTPGLWASWENEAKRPGLIANGFIGAIPWHPVLTACLKRIEDMTGITGPSCRQTGPWMFSRVVRETPMSDVTIFPSITFLPAHHHDDARVDSPLSFGRHFWFSTKKRSPG